MTVDQILGGPEQKLVQKLGAPEKSWTLDVPGLIASQKSPVPHPDIEEVTPRRI